MVVACNRLHPIDQRMCRWLRMTYNRTRRSEYPLRHEFLVQMLGVQRPTLSTAASMLQRAGLISYRYGKLTIKSGRSCRRRLRVSGVNGSTIRQDF